MATLCGVTVRIPYSVSSKFILKPDVVTSNIGIAPKFMLSELMLTVLSGFSYLEIQIFFKLWIFGHYKF